MAKVNVQCDCCVAVIG